MAVQPDDAEVRRGRTELAALAFGGAFLLLLIGLLAWARGGALRPVVTFGRAAVAALFGVLALRGTAWAFRVLEVWFGLIALVFAMGALAAAVIAPAAGLFIFVFSLLFAAATVRLHTSRAIRAYRASGAAERERLAPERA